MATIRVTLLGYTTLKCGCICGRYRERDADHREIDYIEDRAEKCGEGHTFNRTTELNETDKSLPLRQQLKDSGRA